MTDLTAPTLAARIRAAHADQKAAQVLEAGYEAFLQFGLRRASMQDIADRAGMSRAALYLHFKNKDAIFRAMLAAYFDAAAEAAAEALAAHDDVAQALISAFEAQMGDAAEQMIRSPHAEELLSHKSQAADVLEAGNAKLIAVYARWLEVGVQAGRIDPTAVAGSAERMALVMITALDGMKAGATDWEAYVDARRHLARSFARAIEVR